MRFWKAVLPNVTIALNVALLVICYLDMRNPMMGFFVGAPFYTLIIINAICAIATGIVLYAQWRNGRNAPSEGKKVSNNT